MHAMHALNRLVPACRPARLPSPQLHLHVPGSPHDVFPSMPAFAGSCAAVPRIRLLNALAATALPALRNIGSIPVQGCQAFAQSAQAAQAAMRRTPVSDAAV